MARDPRWRGDDGRGLSRAENLLYFLKKIWHTWFMNTSTLPSNEALLDAAKRGDIGGIRAALADGAQNLNGALFAAAREGHATAAGYLVDRGADPHARDNCGDTPLHKAAMKSHTEVAALLLEKGAKLNARDNFGDTPLHKAAGGATRKWRLSCWRRALISTREIILVTPPCTKRRGGPHGSGGSPAGEGR
jgi:hypothetical protein